MSRTSAPRLVCFHGSPLVRVGAAGVTELEAWGDIESERMLLEAAVADAGAQVAVAVIAATARALRFEVTRGFRALHYAGHGSHGALSFEDGHGGAHELSPTALHDLLAAGGAWREGAGGLVEPANQLRAASRRCCGSAVRVCFGM